MKVHRCVGSGFPEAVYQRPLLMELEKFGLKGSAEVEKDVHHEDHFIAKRRLDLRVEDKVLVGVKALSEPDKSSHNKMINYLRVFKIEVGLLLNFGPQAFNTKGLSIPR